MSAAWFLALAHARHSRLRTSILALCVALAILLPLATRLVIAQYRADLTARADATPIAIGRSGSKVDLALLAMYFRPSSLEPLSMAEFDSLRAEVAGLCVPIHARYTTRHLRIVATIPEYFEARNLRTASGTLPTMLGEVVLGFHAHQSLGVHVGMPIFSDQSDVFDISKPPALKMRVCGILAQSHTPDDHAVFVDLKTAWILEGLSHGHADPSSLPASMILDRSATNVVVSEQLIHFNEVTPRSAPSFHVHAPPEHLPLSAVLIFPLDHKDATISRALVNQGRDPKFQRLQAVVCRDVVDDLLSTVLQIRLLLDAVSCVLAASTALLLALISALSARVREREWVTLHRLGGPASTVRALIAFEFLIVLLSGSFLAGAGLLVLRVATPRLISLLS